jgi:hypothetical protein
MRKLTDILKKHNRGRLSSDTGSSSQMTSMSSRASDSTETFLNQFVSSSTPVLKKDKKEKGQQQKGRLPCNPPSPPSSPEMGEEYMKIDLQSMTHMERIVNPSISGQNIAPSNVSPSSTIDPSTASTSLPASKKLASIFESCLQRAYLL